MSTNDIGGSKLFLICLLFLFVVFIVLAAVPTHTSPALNTTTLYNDTTANLTLFNQTTADTDNNAVKNIVDWRISNLSLAVINMPFENYANSTRSVDYTSYSNNGTISGGITASLAAGVDGRGAYNFTGLNNQYIEVADSASLNFVSGITLSAWVKVLGNAQSTTGALFSRWECINNNVRTEFQFLLLDNNQRAFTFVNNLNGSSISITPPSTFLDNTWHHVAFTFDNSSRIATFYLDGAVDNFTTNIPSEYSITNRDLPFRIGSRYCGSLDLVVNLTMDDILVYNRSLSAAQISMIYNNQTKLIDSSQTTTGEAWSACITPNDGTSGNNDGQMLCSNQVSILSATNFLPTQGTPILNTTHPANTSNQNLTLYNQTTTDPENNAVKNIVDWRISNLSLAVINMPFENYANTTRSVDYTSYSNNGTLAGGITASSTAGVDGRGAYTLNGTNTQYIEIADSASLYFNTGLTLAMWVNVKGNMQSTNGALASRWECINNNANTEFLWLLNDGNTQSFAFINNLNGSSYVIAPSNTFSDNTWHHLAFTFDNTTRIATFYLDGTAINYTTNIGSQYSLLNRALPLRIASRYCGSIDLVINATIDDVLIYNRSLSAAQISMIYNNQTNLIDSAETTTGEAWSACITPNDGTTGNNDGQMLCSNQLVIASNGAPTTPTLHLPLNNTNFSYNNIVLNWSNSSDVDNNVIHYFLQIANDNAFTSLQFVNTSIAETTNVTIASIPALTNGTHYWRVLATDGTLNSSYSEIRTFNTTVVLNDTTVPTISLISNNNTTPKKTNSIFLNWTVSDETNLASTWIQIRNSTGVFNNTPQILSGISGVGNYTYITNDPKNTNLSFLAFANDTVNNVNSIGTTLSIIVQNTAPGVPALYLPLNYTNASFLTMSLNWSNITDIDGDNISYYVEVSSLITFASVEYANNVPETANVTNALTSGLTNGTHYWRVLATDTNANSSYSTIRIFNATITQNDTLQPFLSSIQSTNNEPNNGDTITLNWSMTDDTALSSTWIQVRNSTSVINSTIQIVTGTSNQSNYTYIVGDISGTIISFTAFVNDTRDNVNSTTQNFTVASSAVLPDNGPTGSEKDVLIEDISIKLSGPKLVYFGKNTKEKIIGLTIKNDGNVLLNNLEVSISKRGPLDIYLAPSSISRLSPGKEKTVLLTIKKLEDSFEPVDLTMSVISKEPETSDSYDITITSGVKLQEQTEESDEESDEETTPSIDSLPEPAEETTEEDVQQQLALLEKLLNEYEQCKNIPDLLSQAKEELANGNIAKSQELLDFALTNCRDTLQAEQREQPSTILTPDSNASKIAISAGVIVLLSLFGYALYTRNSSLKK